MTEDKDPTSPMLDELTVLRSVRKYPVRIKCALLGFDALQQALAKLGTEADTPGEGH